MSARPILFISHEATRTGAPRVLADLAGQLPAVTGRAVCIHTMVYGPMASEFARLSDATADASDPIAVVVNGTQAAHALLDHRARPRVVYSHEQGEALRQLPPDVVSALATADRVLAVSESARRDLVALGVPADRVFVLEPPVRTDPVTPSSDADLIELGLRPTRRLVVACGEAVWRKGPDLFIALASHLSVRPDLDFAWIGLRQRPEARRLNHDVRMTGLEQHMHWLGELNDPRPIMARADVFVLCSREDPQPLVPLEASLSGVPTVGFSVGGMAEHIARGRALGAAYADVDRLAAHVATLLDDRQARVDLAAEMRRYAIDRRTARSVAEGFATHLESIGVAPRLDGPGSESVEAVA